MKIYSDTSLSDFEAWSGGKDTLDTLTDDQITTVESYLEDLYPDGMENVELNDFLWFERDTIADWLGYRDWEHLEQGDEDEEDEDEEDEDEEDEDEDDA